MRMLFLAALLEISLSCLAQAIRTLPPTGAEPSLLFTTPAAAQALAFFAPPSTHPAQTQPPSDQGCPAPKIQFLATTTRPHAITWPQTQFKNIPGESPWPSLQTINLTSTASLRLSHGLQLRVNVR